MKLFITLSKRNLCIILLAIVFWLAIAMRASSARLTLPDGSTNALRVAFLESKGISAEDVEVFSKNITIPEKFNDVYEKYNSLQKQAGFDLSRYKGKEAVIYTYPLGKNTEAHIIVYKGSIIGGDVASVEFGGEMKPLK